MWRGGCGLTAAIPPGDLAIQWDLAYETQDLGLRRRVATASRYISDFGVAMYCGFGRQPGQDGLTTMREHAEAVRAARG